MLVSGPVSDVVRIAVICDQDSSLETIDDGPANGSLGAGWLLTQTSGAWTAATSGGCFPNYTSWR